MAISAFTRRKLAAALGSQSAANAVVTILDNGSGTVSEADKSRIANSIGSYTTGNNIVTKLQTDASLTSLQVSKLTQVLGETASDEVNTELGS